MDYMKDPLQKEETAYDYFRKKSGINVSPRSSIRKIKMAYRKTLEKHPEEFEKAGQMLDNCSDVTKRLVVDFLYYRTWRDPNDR